MPMRSGGKLPPAHNRRLIVWWVLWSQQWLIRQNTANVYLRNLRHSGMFVYNIWGKEVARVLYGNCLLTFNASVNRVLEMGGR